MKIEKKQTKQIFLENDSTYVVLLYDIDQQDCTLNW